MYQKVLTKIPGTVSMDIYYYSIESSLSLWGWGHTNKITYYFPCFSMSFFVNDPQCKLPPSKL